MPGMTTSPQALPKDGGIGAGHACASAPPCVGGCGMRGTLFREGEASLFGLFVHYHQSQRRRWGSFPTSASHILPLCQRLAMTMLHSDWMATLFGTTLPRVPTLPCDWKQILQHSMTFGTHVPELCTPSTAGLVLPKWGAIEQPTHIRLGCAVAWQAASNNATWLDLRDVGRGHLLAASNTRATKSWSSQSP